MLLRVDGNATLLVLLANITDGGAWSTQEACGSTSQRVCLLISALSTEYNEIPRAEQLHCKVVNLTVSGWHGCDVV